MPVISQIMTGHVLRTVVEHMNILSVLHDLQCVVSTVTIQERVPVRTLFTLADTLLELGSHLVNCHHELVTSS